MSIVITDDYLTIPQAAGLIGVTPGRVRQMVLSGEIVGEQVPPRQNSRWLIRRSEVDRIASIQQSVGRPRKSARAI
jgi:excisionase family DNA binding protein